jgi:hypothetical protein
VESFFVRNLRRDRTLTLYGRVLAPASIGGRTNSMVLSLEQLLGDPCVEQIKLGRLGLRGPMPDELVARLAEISSTEAPAPSQEPPLSVLEAPAVEPPAPAVLSADVVEPQVEIPAVEEPKNTAESLKALSVSELRKIAKGYKIKSSGTEDELIQRILDHEAGVS